MKSTTILSMLCLFVLLISCQEGEKKKHDLGTVKENTYDVSEIGWSIDIPEGWNLVDTDKMKKMAEKGNKLVQDATDIEIESDEIKYLIMFKKNNQNMFQSILENVPLEAKLDYDSNFNMVKELVAFTYENQGMSIDTSATSITQVNGVPFHHFDVKILNPESGDVILNQKFFSRLYKDFQHSVIINYNDDAYGQVMMEAFENSRFKIRANKK